MHVNLRTITVCGAAALLGLLAAACSSRSVSGQTYQDSTGNLKLEFTSGNKAYLRLGAMTQPCGYSQSSLKVVLSCSGDKIKLKVGNDGALSGPPDGMLARLTKVRH